MFISIKITYIYFVKNKSKNKLLPSQLMTKDAYKILSNKIQIDSEYSIKKKKP